MKKILVLWFIVQSLVCGPEITPDPYTGQFPTMVPAIVNYKRVEKLMQQEFPSVASAEAFIASAPAHVRSVMHLVVLDPVEVGP